MKAILLVAGYATRLYPLTIDKPKALLPICGRPMLDYIMDELEALENIDDVYVVSNHRFYEHFTQWAEAKDTTKRIKVLDDGTTGEDNRLGAIGDIRFVVDSEKIDEDTVIICGDNYFTFSLKEYYDFFVEKGTDCVCAKELDDIELLKRFAVAKLSDSQRILELEEKPKNPESNIAVYATYMYKKDTLLLLDEYLSQGNSPDAPGYFVQWLYKKMPVHAYIMNGECFDIGTPEAYEEIQSYVAERKAPGDL